MEFYFYVYLRSGKVTIHRAECPFCRQGKGLQRKIFKNANGFWQGPHPDYEVVVDQASRKACEMNVVPTDCKHCCPSLAVRFASVGNEGDYGDEPVERRAVTYERNRSATLKQLNEQHATEQRQFINFYQNIQQLMEERHKSEQDFAETYALGLDVRSISVQLHAQQVAELAEAQRVSYTLLQEKQALEKANHLQLRRPGPVE